MIFGKELLQLKKDNTYIYNEIIKKYVALNIMFKLDNPLEIYTLYTKLLYNGYKKGAKL